MRQVLWLAVLGCGKGDPPEDEADGDSPAPDDGDADTDTDSDTDVVETGTTETGTPPDTDPVLTGPISPGLYFIAPVFVYPLPAPPPPPIGTGDTGPLPIDDTAIWVRFGASFGYDGNGHVLEVLVNGEPYPSVLEVYLGNAAWEGTLWDLDDTRNYCTVIVPLATGALAPWVAYTQRLYWGTEYLAGPLGGDCGTVVSPIDVSALGDPIVDWENQTATGAAVGGLLPEVRDRIEDDLGTFMTYVIGAQFRIDVLFGANNPIDDAFAYAYQIDVVTGEIVVDANNELVLIEADALHPFP